MKMRILTANKSVADALNSWLGVIAMFCGGAYALLEYIEHKQSVKVERSLSYVEDYRGGSSADAKLYLNQLLATNQDMLTQILSKEYSNNTQLNTAYNDFIIQITKDSTVQRNLEISFSFYEEVAICVERKLCDGDVVQSFFVDDAKALFNAYYPYICSLRKQWKNNNVYAKTERFYVNSQKNICL